MTTMWALLLGGVSTLTGLFGWSHAGLRKRLELMEQEINKRPKDEEVRLMIADKLAPVKVEYLSLSRRLEDLKDSQKELDHKLEKIIDLIQNAR